MSAHPQQPGGVVHVAQVPTSPDGVHYYIPQQPMMAGGGMPIMSVSVPLAQASPKPNYMYSTGPPTGRGPLPGPHTQYVLQPAQHTQVAQVPRPPYVHHQPPQPRPLHHVGPPQQHHHHVMGRPPPQHTAVMTRQPLQPPTPVLPGSPEVAVPHQLLNHAHPSDPMHALAPHDMSLHGQPQPPQRRVQRGLEENVKRTIYVSHVDVMVSEEQLATFFNQCGPVIDCRICADPNSAMRFAFLEFSDVDSAQKAISMSGTLLGGWPLRVQASKTAIVPVSKNLMPRSQDELMRCARTVYVTSIDKRVEKADLCAFFESLCGPVAKLRLLGDASHTTRIAFVEFLHAEGASAALNCSGALLGAMPVRVSPSKTPIRLDTRTSRGSSSSRKDRPKREKRDKDRDRSAPAEAGASAIGPEGGDTTVAVSSSAEAPHTAGVGGEGDATHADTVPEPVTNTSEHTDGADNGSEAPVGSAQDASDAPVAVSAAEEPESHAGEPAARTSESGTGEAVNESEEQTQEQSVTGATEPAGQPPAESTPHADGDKGQPEDGDVAAALGAVSL